MELMLLTMMEFIAFPDRKDSIFQAASNSNTNIAVESSGSIGIYYDNKCHLTYPNETVIVNAKMDWCSNVAKSEDDKPWVEYHLSNKAVMKLTGYSLRNGCCYRRCCCVSDNSFLDSEWCCCRLYSFSLQGSNDNKTWKVIHKVEKDDKFYLCYFKTYEFEKTESFKYIRLVQEKEYPGCPFCMQLNQIDLYGELILDPFVEPQYDDNDESVSIIGKLKRASNE